MTTATKQARPVNAAEALQYFRDKLAFTTGPVEISHRIEEGEPLHIVDVRAAADYEKAHVPGAVSYPRDKWDSDEGLSKDQNNILYCYSHVCHLAAAAAVKLASRGYPVVEMDGGFAEWQANGLPTQSGH
jgi:rhodanese-related sulfurtransferase